MTKTHVRIRLEELEEMQEANDSIKTNAIIMARMSILSIITSTLLMIISVLLILK